MNQLHTMTEGIKFIEPVELYNLLNQLSMGVPRIANECYLLLLDTRKQKQYSESHIIRACHVPYDADNERYLFPKYIDYSTIENVVVMDSQSSSRKDVFSSGIKSAELLWNMGSKYPVKIVKGGFEEFSALYPFLRSQKILYTQKEVMQIKMYPVEVIPGFLYMGIYKQACDADVAKHLKIKVHVNVTMNDDLRFSVDDCNKGLIPQVMDVKVEDSAMADILSKFALVCSFIDRHHVNDGKGVLVYSDLGISRCVTIVLAYLMNKNKISVKEAVAQISKCHKSICPNRGFVDSMLQWEKIVLEREVTERTQLRFLSYD